MMNAKNRLDRDELRYFRKRLLDERADLIRDVTGLEHEANDWTGEPARVPGDLADRSSDEWEEDLLRSLAEHERRMLFEIDDALTRIDKGTYGICELTGKPISKTRLKALPWARRTIRAEREIEARSPREGEDL